VRCAAVAKLEDKTLLTRLTKDASDAVRDAAKKRLAALH